MALTKALARGLSGSELRAEILLYFKSQADFARTYGVSVNVVSGWIKRGAPKHALAYLALHSEFAAYRRRVKEQVAGLVE